MSDVFNGYGVVVSLRSDDAFNIIRETLTRIGVASYRNKTLTQSCHIFHKKGEYAIMHFKEMLAYDGKTDNVPDDDLKRRNTIVKLLKEWGLVTVLDDDFENDAFIPMSEIKVLSAKEKSGWELRRKYTIGRR